MRGAQERLRLRADVIRALTEPEASLLGGPDLPAQADRPTVVELPDVDVHTARPSDALVAGLTPEEREA